MTTDLLARPHRIAVRTPSRKLSEEISSSHEESLKVRSCVRASGKGRLILLQNVSLLGAHSEMELSTVTRNGLSHVLRLEICDFINKLL